jgi:hypothetical protein
MWLLKRIQHRHNLTKDDICSKRITFQLLLIPLFLGFLHDAMQVMNPPRGPIYRRWPGATQIDDTITAFSRTGSTKADDQRRLGQDRNSLPVGGPSRKNDRLPQKICIEFTDNMVNTIWYTHYVWFDFWKCGTSQINGSSSLSPTNDPM